MLALPGDADHRERRVGGDLADLLTAAGDVLRDALGERRGVERHLVDAGVRSGGRGRGVVGDLADSDRGDRSDGGCGEDGDRAERGLGQLYGR